MGRDDHLNILKQGVSAWNKWVEKATGVVPDLSEADLSYSELIGINLSGANLINTKLVGANLIAAEFSGAKLSGANFLGAKLSGAKLNRAIILNANFGYTTLEQAQLNKAQLTGGDFRGADLSGATLISANLNNTNFNDSKLIDANISQAKLVDAKLNRARLCRIQAVGAVLSQSVMGGIDLTDSDLSSTDLTRADLTNANLERAKLRGTKLLGAKLNDANLNGTDLTRAEIGWTLFANNDLRNAIGLETVIHRGPSTIGIDTIYTSRAIIPEVFLRGAGISDTFITYMSSLTNQAIHYYSCFLSHGNSDGDFADRLRNDLLANNVSCWHYQYDMRGGRFWRAQINEAIKVHEKLVLICSEESLQRRNVVDEIITAMERERETHSQKLFPIRLDNFILCDEMLEIADKKMLVGEWREDWVRYIRAYHIPDFKNWKNHDAYREEFRKFLDALKEPAKR